MALLDKNDQHHANAAAFLRTNLKATYYIAEPIFAETMTLIKARLGAQAAVALGDRTKTSSQFVLVPFTDEDRYNTWTIFSSYTDKEWSYFDCSVLAIARRLGIRYVFAFDHHFDQMAELTRVPRI